MEGLVNKDKRTMEKRIQRLEMDNDILIEELERLGGGASIPNLGLNNDLSKKRTSSTNRNNNNTNNSNTNGGKESTSISFFFFVYNLVTFRISSSFTSVGFYNVVYWSLSVLVRVSLSLYSGNYLLTCPL